MNDQNSSEIIRENPTCEQLNKSTSKSGQLYNQSILKEQMMNSQTNQQLNRSTNRSMNQQIVQQIQQQNKQQFSFDQINQLISIQQSADNLPMILIDHNSLDYLKELQNCQMNSNVGINSQVNNTQHNNSSITNVSSVRSETEKTIRLPSFCTLNSTMCYSSPNFTFSSNNQTTNTSVSSPVVNRLSSTGSTINHSNLTNYNYLHNAKAHQIVQERIQSSVGSSTSSNNLFCAKDYTACCTFSRLGACTCLIDVCQITCCCRLANNETIDLSTRSKRTDYTDSISSNSETKRMKVSESAIAFIGSTGQTSTFAHQKSNLDGSYLFDSNASPTDRTSSKEDSFNFAIPNFPNDPDENQTDQNSQINLTNQVDGLTVELVERRMKSQPKMKQGRKNNPLVISDTIGLNLDDLSTYTKIANMFYHLNLKLGNAPSNQLFELGVFFGIMIERYPDIMEFEGSGADNLRGAFISTRKHFKDILRQEGKLIDEDETKSVKSVKSGTDSMDQLNLSSNSTSSLLSTSHKNYTAISKRQ